MSFREFRSFAWQYALIGIMLVISWYFSTHFTETIGARISGVNEGSETLLVLFSIVIVFVIGFIVYELAKPTALPSFVLAIFFGIVCRDILSLLVENPVSLATLITIGAVLILFEGGLETPFTKFKTLLGPILSLAIIGTLINALLLSMLMESILQQFGIELPLITIVLLGAALASTDPAAIIPSFKGLLFTHPRVKHIAVSESAINDVLGAVLVTIFLSLFLHEYVPFSVPNAYSMLLTIDVLIHIFSVIFIGTIVGLLGYGILQWWSNWKLKILTEEGSDAALFLGVPLFVYTFASVLGGSGFLAVFVSSLMFHIRSHFRHVEHYFNHTVEGFMKPIIFMLLGAMVEPANLIEVAPAGIVIGLLFMFVLRPLIVLLVLVPFCFTKQKMTMRELLFLSFVRETGVIPAVLLITISLAGIPGSAIMTSIGLWVILLTLTIEPPLTPYVAKKLGIARENPPLLERKHQGPVAVLCSRGYSFPERMKTVVQWAEGHSVENIMLLHCPEERYSDEFVAGIENEANELFYDINDTLTSKGEKELNFEFLCGPGLLQDNIERLIAEGDVSIIFVGTKMLDYRLEDVKRLNVPFYFMQ